MVVGLNLGAALYVGYVVVLFTEWPVDAIVAAGLSTAGWWSLSAERFAFGAATALLTAGVLYLVNRLLLGMALGGRAARWARRLALGAGGLVLLAALVMSLYVALRRPVA